MGSFERFRRDVTLGIRALMRQPGFALAAMVTLALGIGANTAVFSVIRHVLLKPIPYADPDRVVMIWSKWTGFEKTWVSDAEALDYKSVSAFEDAGAWSSTQVNLTGGDADPLRIGAAFVTPNTFAILGVSPSRGRAFTEEEGRATVASAVVLSHGLWRRRFGGDPAAVGQTVLINGVGREIVGVMPSGFQLPTDYVAEAEEPTELWLPGNLDASNRGNHGLYAVARLRPGISVSQANAELKVLTDTWTKQGLYPVPMQFSAFALGVMDEAVAGVRPALLLVFGAVGFLLLIACANVANLLLVRADGRRREMAVRSALGANRWRLVRQLVTEGAVLATASAALGIAVALLAIRVVASLDATTLPRAADVSADTGVLAFSALLTLGTLLLFGLAPALRAARVDLVDALKDGTPSASAGKGRQRLRGALVVAETALAVLLLAGAGLMLRSLWALQRIDLGFDPERVLTLRLALPASQYDTPEKVVAFYEDLVTRVRAMPRVERTGLERILPLATTIGDWGLRVEGYTPPAGVGTPGDWQIATAGGPEALGERLVRGRWLTDADTAGAEDVALVNEAMARKYWAGRDALGGRFRMGGNPAAPAITVVGIVGDVRHNGVTADVKPKFYRAFAQWHRSSGNPARNMTLIAKTSGDPRELIAPIRAEIRRMDADLPMAAVQTMDEVVAEALATPRLAGWMLGLFAALAVSLAAVGIYSVLSYVVSQRRQEIGVRLALGAERRHVLVLILRSGLSLTGAGLVAGLGLSALATRAIASQLHGVTPFDPVTYAAVAAILACVSLAACLTPAIRAMRISPTRAIRQ